MSWKEAYMRRKYARMSDDERAELLIGLLDAGNVHDYWTYYKVPLL